MVVCTNLEKVKYDMSDHVDESKPDTLEVEKQEHTSHMPDEQWLATEKRLVRKLDFTLVPMLWVLYLFNYLDRNNIA